MAPWLRVLAASSKCWYQGHAPPHSVLALVFQHSFSVVQLGLKTPTYLRMTLNFWPSCLYLARAEMRLQTCDIIHQFKKVSGGKMTYDIYKIMPSSQIFVLWFKWDILVVTLLRMSPIGSCTWSPVGSNVWGGAGF